MRVPQVPELLVTRGIRGEKRHPVALGVLRGQVRGSGLVKIVHASFAEAVLPEAHLVHAGYSLPFCAPAGFPEVWAAVRDALVPGGLFAGQFLGPRDGWAGSDGMTFRDAGEVGKLALSSVARGCDGGRISGPCCLRERAWDGRAAGGPTQWHGTVGILRGR